MIKNGKPLPKGDKDGFVPKKGPIVMVLLVETLLIVTLLNQLFVSVE